MAKRSLLHRSKLAGFEKWLVAKGYELQKTKSVHEILRANVRTKHPLVIYIKADAIDYLTVMNRDEWIVRKYLEEIG